MTAHLIGGGTPAAAGTSARGGRRRWRPPTAWTVLLAPAVILLVLVFVWPVGRTIYLSFTSLDAAGTSSWQGLGNYIHAFADPQYLQALGTTAVFVAVGIVAELVLGFALALLLAKRVSVLGRALRVIFAIPMMLAPIVVASSWRLLLNPNWGWIDVIIGMPNTDWLGDPSRALWVMIAVDVWQWTPYMFMLITAGLLGLPSDIYEAAAIDGAGRIRTFWSMTLPLMTPVIIVAALLRSVEAAKTFDLPYALTSGGPGTSTQTVGLLIYRSAFQEFNQGYASALSVITSVIMLVFVVLYMRGLRAAERRVDQ